MTRTRRWSLLLAAVAGVVLLAAQPAMACGGLVGPGGTVQLARTTTLAGYHDGVEHYLTSFTYAGGGARFGSIVPLPGVPTDVRKGGEWTLQRLVRETQPQRLSLATAQTFAPDASGAAEELLTTRVDALDLTVPAPGRAQLQAQGTAEEPARASTAEFTIQGPILGLDQGDAVIRRQLRLKMEFLGQDAGSLGEPTEADEPAASSGRSTLSATGRPWRSSRAR